MELIITLQNKAGETITKEYTTPREARRIMQHVKETFEHDGITVIRADQKDYYNETVGRRK